QLILAIPLSDVTGTLNQLLLIELAVTGGALLLAGLVGFWLVRLGLRPLVSIEHTAGEIARGRLGHRVPGESRRTEVGRLAGALNIMLDRIQSAFAARDATEARLRRFVADASHELRTPVAAVSAYAELFDRGASTNPDDLARVMHGIRGETARMSKLVEDLLLLARMDEGLTIERRPVELVGLTAEAVETAAAVGPRWPVTIHARSPVEVAGDHARLRQVVDNLLANVRAHTPPGTLATVTVSGESDRAIIEVADQGPGITTEQAERVFQRFYRADPSRSRSRGGAGLGLAIVAGIVAAHGGTVEAAPGRHGGAVFTVSLPAAPAVTEP
ncbi:MAG TPA: HAMP domain-containing sensor histidine kinase, partial [Acidimicrobiales bacterium]|nr:HAMP domain-containing sensor histidine kinase [Acidimicrobiales bacterium]